LDNMLYVGVIHKGCAQRGQGDQIKYT